MSATVHEWFAEQVRADPDAVALIDGEHTVSYAELDRWAGATAARLREHGVGARDVVGICLPRSGGYIAALLGTLRAGAACLLLSPQDPASRVAMMVRDAGPAAVITAGDDFAPAPELTPVPIEPGPPPDPADGSTPSAGPAVPVDPGAPAIIVATSGSTGRPKSVLLSHRACCSGIPWARRTFGLTPADRHLFKTSVNFVSVLRHILWPLLTGGATVIVPPGEEANLPLLATLIHRHRVSVTTFIPSSFRLFLDTRGAKECESLRHIACGGEVLTAELRATAARVLPAATVHNVYALSEVPLVTHWRCRQGEDGVSPMGAPVDGARLLILDEDGEPAPTGTVGELLVGGPGVASGYLGGDPADRQRFVRDRWPGAVSEQLYRTGDQVVLEPGAEPVLRYVGRRDHRVKVHGYRIELGEIESAATALPGVTGAVVLAEPRGDGDHEMTMYLTLSDRSAGTAAELRARLRDSLPGYMIPPVLHLLDEFPFLPNGKIDRVRLAAEAPTVPRAEPEAAPVSVLDRRVTEEWRAVLPSSTGSGEENFFDAGGDSLAAMRLANRLQAVVDEQAGTTGDAAAGAVISVHTVIRHPVLSQLVGAVRGACPATTEPEGNDEDTGWEEGTI